MILKRFFVPKSKIISNHGNNSINQGEGGNFNEFGAG